jgi:cyclic nucleotide-binding protein
MARSDQLLRVGKVAAPRFGGMAIHQRAFRGLTCMSANSFLMSWQNWAANFCYLLLAVSYLVTNLYWLRALAVVALGLEGIYFYFASTPPLWVGISWAAVFVAINLVQLAIMSWKEFGVRLSEDEQLLYRGPFAGLSRVQFHHLLKIGIWRAVDDGAILTIENEPVPELLLITNGTARVMVAQETVAFLQAGSFIGEMSFMRGGNASANVVAAGPLRLFVIDKPALASLLHHDHDIESAILRVIGRDLAGKLRTQTLPG